MTRKAKLETESRSTQVVGYCRVSTEEQANEGVSLEAQEAALRAYCTMRGLTLAEMVIDAGISAGKALASREGGQRVLELVKQSKVGAVVAWKLDRLFRDAGDCLNVTGDWDKRGIALHLVDMGGQAIDTSTAMGRFFLTVMAGAAEMERNLIRERTTSGMAFKRSKGERVGAIPFGHRLAADGVALELEPAEQEVIAMVKTLRADGFTLQQIVDRLTLDGVPSRGKAWHLTSVVRILKRAA
jgi:site-specific DNA recombinase